MAFLFDFYDKLVGAVVDDSKNFLYKKNKTSTKQANQKI
jgi:hypothetical protein